MSELKTAIENLYLVFGKYTTEGIHHCNCGCINEEKVKQLYSKSLRFLEMDVLAYYQGCAIYTWGEVEHYKHYIPRILELYAVSKRDYALIGLDEVANKLEYAKWTEWPENEVQSIIDFVQADWIDYINNSITKPSDFTLANYSRFIDVDRLLKKWNITQSDIALRNFIEFFYYYGNQVLNKGLRINEQLYNRGLKELIYTNKLTDRLQEEFFKYEIKDKEYAEKTSVVLQMIEQQGNHRL